MTHTLHVAHAEPSADDMLDTRAAADVLGVSPKTLNKWRCKGGGPRFVAVGAAIRYRRSALADYIERRTFGKTGDIAAAA